MSVKVSKVCESELFEFSVKISEKVSEVSGMPKTQKLWKSQPFGKSRDIVLFGFFCWGGVEFLVCCLVLCVCARVFVFSHQKHCKTRRQAPQHTQKAHTQGPLVCKTRENVQPVLLAEKGCSKRSGACEDCRLKAYLYEWLEVHARLSVALHSTYFARALSATTLVIQSRSCVCESNSSNHLPSHGFCGMKTGQI